MPWGVAAAAAAAIGGAALQSKGAKDAAKAQQQGTDASIAEQRRQFDLIREDQAPYQQVGTNALNALAGISGIAPYREKKPALSFDDWAKNNPVLPTGPGQDGMVMGLANQQEAYQNYLTGLKSPAAPTTPDYSAFFKSPDYTFALDQGTQAIERSAAARGGLNSGNTLTALRQYGQGLATQNFGNYTNRLASLAGIGQTATNNLSSAGLTTGANVGNALVAGGNARASGIVNQGNAWGNALNDIGSAAGYYLKNRKNSGNYMFRGNDGYTQTFAY